MANFDGAKAFTPTLTSAPASGGGTPAGNASILGQVQGHHGLIGLVLVAAIALVILDRVGFRFVFTAGKR